METNYTEQIQIYKTNKIAALYPTAKLIIVVLYIFCTLVIGNRQNNKFIFTAASDPRIWYCCVSAHSK